MSWACVNACEGIKDPSAVRDLLAAAKKLENGWRGITIMRDLGTAIDKIEGRRS